MIKVIKASQVPTYKGPGDGETKILVDSDIKATNLSLGWIKFPAGGKTDPHTRDVEEYIYVIKGKTAVTAGNERLEFGEGDVIFIPAGIEHLHENIGSEDLEQIWIFAPQGPEQGLKDLPTLD